MHYETSAEGVLTVFAEGDIDASNTNDIEERVMKELENAKDVIWDFNRLEYISSAGLRVLLTVQKHVKQNGHTMVIRGCSEEVNQIFKVTGFVRLLTFEN